MHKIYQDGVNILTQINDIVKDVCYLIVRTCLDCFDREQFQYNNKQGLNLLFPLDDSSLLT